MYPTISHLIEDLTGLHIPLPVQSFGFFVAVSFLLAAWVLSLELKRKEEEGLLSAYRKKVLKGAPASLQELLLNGLLGFILGFKLVLLVSDYGRFTDDPQAMILSWEGSWPGGIAVGVLFAWLRYREKKKYQLPKPEWVEAEVHPYHLVADITVLAAVAGLLGAKIFHNLEYPEDFLADPLGALLSFSGLTFYGGLIFGAAAVLWFGRGHGIPVLHMLDVAAPALMLAYGVGRIGCQISGDGDWGIVNMSAMPSWLSFLPDWCWSYDYPHNVINEGVPIPGCSGKFCAVLPHPVFPTPLYEAVAGILLSGVLWMIRRRITLPGALFAVYLILSGLERLAVEQIRVNAEYHLFGLSFTQAEAISVACIVVGLDAIFLLQWFRKGK